MRHAVLLACLLLIPAVCLAGVGLDIDIELPDKDSPKHANEAICQAVSACATLLAGADAEPGLLAENGCYIWQQPGVGLVVSGIWEPGTAPELWYSEDELFDFLIALPDWKYDEPFVYPSEPENADEFYVEPQVYLLRGKEANRRLDRYMSGYSTWIEYMGGDESIVPMEEDLFCDFAVVYIDNSGPLEFHFKADDKGNLRLLHLFLWEFFSA